MYWRPAQGNHDSYRYRERNSCDADRGVHARIDARVCASHSSRDSSAGASRVDALGRFHGGCRRNPRADARHRSAMDRLAGKRRGCAAAFGMKVLALKRNPSERVDTGWCPAGLGDPEGKIPARYFGPDEREAILRESDYISVTLPLTDHTRKFIGEREFAAMKPGAYLVNIGRGAVIDEHAMATALSAGRHRRRRPRRLRARTAGSEQPAVGSGKRHPDAAHLGRQSRVTWTRPASCSRRI